MRFTKYGFFGALSILVLSNSLALAQHDSSNPLRKPARGSCDTADARKCAASVLHRLLGDDLIASLGYNPQVRIVPGVLPNAYATREQAIVLSSGLFANASEDELAFVIAHELGHLVLHTSTSAPLALLSPQQRYEGQVLREIEADQFAIRLLAKAAIDPRCALGLLGRLAGVGNEFHAELRTFYPSLDRRVRALAMNLEAP